MIQSSVQKITMSGRGEEDRIYEERVQCSVSGCKYANVELVNRTTTTCWEHHLCKNCAKACAWKPQLCYKCDPCEKCGPNQRKASLCVDCLNKK
jgi:hypothetical protein